MNYEIVSNQSSNTNYTCFCKRFLQVSVAVEAHPEDFPTGAFFVVEVISTWSEGTRSRF